MKPQPHEIAAELAGGLVDRRTIEVWSVMKPTQLMHLLRTRKIMKDHHPDRTKWAMVCNAEQHQECLKQGRCRSGVMLSRTMNPGDCKRYELLQSYVVMELSDDRG